MEAPFVDTTSPADLARSSGFGISASYLGNVSPALAAELPKDPNVPYIDSLAPAAQSHYLATHANCANTANEQVTAAIEATSAAIEPIMAATYNRMRSTPTYVGAMREWSDCIAVSTGIAASSHDEFKREVFRRYLPKASALAAAGNDDGLRALQTEEIRVASAAAGCEGKRRQQVDPLVREYESTMINAHLQEFTEHRKALELVVE